MRCKKCGSEYEGPICPCSFKEIDEFYKTEVEPYDRIDQKVAMGVFNQIDVQRRFVAQLILTLDIVLITFTPPMLITGLDKLEKSMARPWLFWFGVVGLILGVLSLAFGLLFYGWTTLAHVKEPNYFFGVKKRLLEKNRPLVEKDKMTKAVEKNKKQWRLARTFSRLETVSFFGSGFVNCRWCICLASSCLLGEFTSTPLARTRPVLLPTAASIRYCVVSEFASAGSSMKRISSFHPQHRDDTVSPRTGNRMAEVKWARIVNGIVATRRR